jgi:hypothetical protein
LMKARQKMECELTIKDGKFVYDLNGRASEPWDQPPGPALKQANKWTSLRMAGFGGAPRPIPAAQAGQAQQQRPGRWQPYTTNENGAATVKPEAKVGAQKAANAPTVPPPAVTWPVSPAVSAGWGKPDAPQQ